MSSSEWKDAVKRIPRDERMVFLHLKEEIESLERTKTFAGEQEERRLLAMVEEGISGVTRRVSSIEDTLASIQSDMDSLKDRVTDNATGPKTQVTTDSDAEASANRWLESRYGKNLWRTRVAKAWKDGNLWTVDVEADVKTGLIGSKIMKHSLQVNSNGEVVGYR